MKKITLRDELDGYGWCWVIAHILLIIFVIVPAIARGDVPSTDAEWAEVMVDLDTANTHAVCASANMAYIHKLGGTFPGAPGNSELVNRLWSEFSRHGEQAGGYDQDTFDAWLDREVGARESGDEKEMLQFLDGLTLYCTKF